LIFGEFSVLKKKRALAIAHNIASERAYMILVLLLAWLKQFGQVLGIFSQATPHSILLTRSNQITANFADLVTPSPLGNLLSSLCHGA
jgi:membrane protein YqaA with SNARE-associated domain